MISLFIVYVLCVIATLFIPGALFYRESFETMRKIQQGDKSKRNYIEAIVFGLLGFIFCFASGFIMSILL